MNTEACVAHTDWHWDACGEGCKHYWDTSYKSPLGKAENGCYKGVWDDPESMCEQDLDGNWFCQHYEEVDSDEEKTVQEQAEFTRDNPNHPDADVVVQEGQEKLFGGVS